MILGNIEIKRQRERGGIVIEPYNEKQLGMNSYDVRLDEWFYRERLPPPTGTCLDIWKDCKSMWDGPHRAMVASDLFPDCKRPVIVIRPGERLLACTQEFIGGRDNITAILKTRSSLARCNVDFCVSAGLGDTGYVNKWTLEITNLSRHYTIPLYVGERVAQIVFAHTTPVEGNYAAHGGHYQSSSNLAELQANWRPEDMLPRLSCSS